MPRAEPATVKQPTPSSQRLPRPYRVFPATPSPRAAAHKPLSWAFDPHSTYSTAVPMVQALPAHTVPPSGFGYPLDGLLLAVPCRLYFAPAALSGFALRSFLLPEGTPRVSAGADPHTVSPPGIPHAEAGGRPGRPRFLGFDPPLESLTAGHVISRPTAGCSLGLRPFKASGGNVGQDFARPPLTRFPDRQKANPAAPQSLAPHPPCSIRSRGNHGRTKQPSWGLRTCTLRGVRASEPSGLWVHLAPTASSLLLADAP